MLERLDNVVLIDIGSYLRIFVMMIGLSLNIKDFIIRFTIWFVSASVQV